MAPQTIETHTPNVEVADTHAPRQDVRPVPANDLVGVEPANDVDRMGHTETKKPKHVRFQYTPAILRSQLEAAGYDASRIPASDHRAALFVAWAWKCRLYDKRDVARSTSLSSATLFRVYDHLRFAAKPGTVTG